eukprot:12236198-Alexandrium_andersonii.AAC.1
MGTVVQVPARTPRAIAGYTSTILRAFRTQFKRVVSSFVRPDQRGMFRSVSSSANPFKCLAIPGNASMCAVWPAMSTDEWKSICRYVLALRAPPSGWEGRFAEGSLFLRFGHCKLDQPPTWRAADQRVPAEQVASGGFTLSCPAECGAWVTLPTKPGRE